MAESHGDTTTSEGNPSLENKMTPRQDCSIDEYFDKLMSRRRKLYLVELKYHPTETESCGKSCRKFLAENLKRTPSFGAMTGRKPFEFTCYLTSKEALKLRENDAVKSVKGKSERIRLF